MRLILSFFLLSLSQIVHAQDTDLDRLKKIVAMQQAQIDALRSELEQQKAAADTLNGRLKNMKIVIGSSTSYESTQNLGSTGGDGYKPPAGTSTWSRVDNNNGPGTAFTGFSCPVGTVAAGGEFWAARSTFHRAYCRSITLEIGK